MKMDDSAAKTKNLIPLKKSEMQGVKFSRNEAYLLAYAAVTGKLKQHRRSGFSAGLYIKNKGDSDKKVGYISEINIARGIGIYLVVLGHALDHFNRNYIPLGSWMNVWSIIYMFHMPLFFFIAGYVYTLSSKSPASYADYSSYLTNKAYRLLLPYLSYSFLLFILKCSLMAFDGKLAIQFFINNSFFILTSPHNGPGPYLWFIYTLFVMFIFSPFVDLTIRKKNTLKVVWAIVFLYLYWLSFIISHTMFVDLCANYIFFFLGYLVSQYSNRQSLFLFLKRHRYHVFLLFLSSSLILFVSSIGEIFKIPYKMAFALIGITSVLSISSWITHRSKEGMIYSILFYSILNRLGRSSYDIYLLHYIVGIYFWGIIYYKVCSFTISQNGEIFIILVILPLLSIVFSLMLSDLCLKRFAFTRKFFLGK